MMIPWLLITFAVGVGVGLLLKPGRKQQLSEATDATDAHKYGHPWSPVAALRRKLPVAPLGHVWEISVKTSDNGSSILTLALVNVATGQNVNSTTMDLTRTRFGKTWAQEYRDYSALTRSIFNNDLIGPAVDWASALANKVATQGQTTEYRMG